MCFRSTTGNSVAGTQVSGDSRKCYESGGVVAKNSKMCNHERILVREQLRSVVELRGLLTPYSWYCAT